MSEFHQHPAGKVYVRTQAATYSDTVANFELDFGQNIPDLPFGADERVYTQGVRHALMNRVAVLHGGSVPWDFGDQAIAQVAQLIAKQTARAPKK